MQPAIRAIRTIVIYGEYFTVKHIMFIQLYSNSILESDSSFEIMKKDGRCLNPIKMKEPCLKIVKSLSLYPLRVKDSNCNCSIQLKVCARFMKGINV